MTTSSPPTPTYDCRKAFAETLIELARADERIVAVCNDSVGSCNLVGFREEFPDRLINVGIAEQDLVGVGAGLANGGLIPFVSAAAPFLTGRALEQIKADVAYCQRARRPVRPEPGHGLRRARPDPPLDRGPVLDARDRQPARCSCRPTRRRPAPPCAGRSRTPARCTCASPRFKVPDGHAGRRASRARPRGPADRRRRRHGDRDRARWSRARWRRPSSCAADGIAARVLNMPFVDPLDDDGGARRGRARRAASSPPRRRTVTGGLGAAVASLRRPAPARADAHPRRHRRSPPPAAPSFLLDHFGLTADGIAAAAASARAWRLTTDPRHRPGHAARPRPCWSTRPAAIVARGSAPVALRTPAARLGRAGRERDLGERPGRGRRLRCRPDAGTRRRRRPQHAARVAAAVGPRDRASRSARCSAGRTSARADCAPAARRTADARCGALSGLPLDPMFSATKARWLLDAYDPTARSRAALCLGTVDSWLLSRLGGEHVIEAGNAARTQLLDVRAPRLGRRRCSTCSASRATCCPRVVPSHRPVPGVRGLAPLPDGTPVCAVMGDSHAALFAHAGWRPGQVKATYGTGSSIMGLGRPGRRRPDGLCLTVAWDDEHGPAHAFEGNIRSTGATLTWLAKLLGTTPAALADAGRGRRSDGVHLVPALRRARPRPWWDDDAVGLITGLTFGTRRAAARPRRAGVDRLPGRGRGGRHRARTSAPCETLLADGGADRQPHADAAAGRHRAAAPSRARSPPELSALGVAHLAGRGAGVWTQDAARGARPPARGLRAGGAGGRAAPARRRLARGAGPRARGPRLTWIHPTRSTAQEET